MSSVFLLPWYLVYAAKYAKWSDEPMMIYKAKDYADMSVLGLATGSTPYRAV